MGQPLVELIESFKLLPGIGQKSAERLAFYVLSMPAEKVHNLASVLKSTRDNVRYCRRCFNLTFQALCDICQHSSRNQKQLCVVADAKSIYALERMQRFRGVYHVLGGLLSPLDGLHPDSLRIKELLQRLKSDEIEELILAINPSIEGEATVLYLKSVLKSFDVKVSTLAYGLPVGSDLDYIDELTLEKAYLGRSNM